MRALVQPGGTTVVASRWKTTAGAVDRLADREAASARSSASERQALPPENALALAEQWARRRSRCRQLLDPRPLAVGRHAQVDDLDRVAEGVTVLLLVQAVELLERLVREAFLRQRNPQLVALADVAAVERRPRPRSRRSGRRPPGAAPRSSSAAAARSRSSRSSSIAPSVMKTVRIWSYLRSLVSRPIAEVMPGIRRHDHLGDAERLGDLGRLHRAAAAEGDERELARVVALLDRARADRARHVGVRDRDDPLRGLEQAEAELGRRAAARRSTAASRSSRISPPRKRSGSMRPSTTFASVIVGSSPPWP